MPVQRGDDPSLDHLMQLMEHDQHEKLHSPDPTGPWFDVLSPYTAEALSDPRHFPIGFLASS
jgi:hypothetical protein